MQFKFGFMEIDDFEKMFKLDKEVFGEELAVDTKTMKDWYRTNKFQWIVAKDEEENIFGYLSLWHLNKETFEKVMSGEKLEKDFTGKDFLGFGESDKIYCYIAGFVAKDIRIAMSIISKTIAYFRFLKEHGIFVEKVGTVAVSKKGIKLSKKLGFRKIREGSPDKDGIIPEYVVIDIKDKNMSRVVNAVKEIMLESDSYLG